jgi:hypothetical protein
MDTIHILEKDRPLCCKWNFHALDTNFSRHEWNANPLKLLNTIYLDNLHSIDRTTIERIPFEPPNHSILQCYNIETSISSKDNKETMNLRDILGNPHTMLAVLSLATSISLKGNDCFHYS